MGPLFRTPPGYAWEDLEGVGEPGQGASWLGQVFGAEEGFSLLCLL